MGSELAKVLLPILKDFFLARALGAQRAQRVAAECGRSRSISTSARPQKGRSALRVVTTVVVVGVVVVVVVVVVVRAVRRDREKTRPPWSPRWHRRLSSRRSERRRQGVSAQRWR